MANASALYRLKPTTKSIDTYLVACGVYKGVNKGFRVVWGAGV